MGKTYKNNSIVSRSIGVTEDKSRGFEKKKDRSSHHSVRNQNRNADEMGIEKVQKRGHIYNVKAAKPSNIPNIQNVDYGKISNATFDIPNYDLEMTPVENIEIFLSNNSYEQNYSVDKKYFAKTLKQYYRRNEVGRFRGYSNERDAKNTI
jgi:hypothetical protein